MSSKEKSLSKGGAFYLIYQVLNLAFPAVTGIYVTHVLVPEKIGMVGAAQNVANYFVIFSFLGIPTYGMREIAKYKDDDKERSKIYSELYVINTISTIVFLSLYLALIILVPTYRNELSLYLITGISIALNFFNVSWLYEGMEDFQFISIRNLIFKVVSFCLLILLVRSKDDYLLYALVTVLGTAGNYVMNIICVKKYVTFSLKSLNLKRHIKSVMYLVAVNLAIEIYSLMDITMMNFMSTKESIAFYKFGHSVELILLQVVNTFTIVLIPRISYSYKEKLYSEFNRLLTKGFKMILLCAVPMIIGILFTADFLMVKLYGNEYIVSARILKIFAILLIVSPVGYLLGSRVLLATENEDKMLISVGTGAIINLVGNAILIPKLHEYGATIASLLSEFIVMIVYISHGRKYFRLEKMKMFAIKLIGAASVMTVSLFLCEFISGGWSKLITQIIVAVTTYSISLLLFKEEITIEYKNKIINKLKALR